VQWYFENRIPASYDSGFTAEQCAANDRLWEFIVTHKATPSTGWLTANNFDALKERIAKASRRKAG
jgi:hypothetical protein